MLYKRVITIVSGVIMMVFGISGIAIEDLRRFAADIDHLTEDTSCEAVHRRILFSRPSSLAELCSSKRLVLRQIKLRCMEDIVLLGLPTDNHINDADPCIYRDAIVRDKIKNKGIKY